MLYSDQQRVRAVVYSGRLAHCTRTGNSIGTTPHLTVIWPAMGRLWAIAWYIGPGRPYWPWGLYRLVNRAWQALLALRPV